MAIPGCWIPFTGKAKMADTSHDPSTVLAIHTDSASGVCVSLFDDGSVSFELSGHVIRKPLRDWFALAAPPLVVQLIDRGS